MKTSTFFTISRPVLLRMRNVSDKFAEKIKAHILCSVTCFRKSCHVWDNVERYCTGGHAIDENMAHANFTFGTQGYKHTLSEYVILLLLYRNNRHTNTHHCYVILRCLSSVIYETCWGGGGGYGLGHSSACESGYKNTTTLVFQEIICLYTHLQRKIYRPICW